MALTHDQISERIERYRAHMERLRSDRAISKKDFDRALQDLRAWAEVKREEAEIEKKKALTGGR
jgi:hypothetical protein